MNTEINIINKNHLNFDDLNIGTIFVNVNTGELCVKIAVTCEECNTVWIGEGSGFTIKHTDGYCEVIIPERIDVYL